MEFGPGVRPSSFKSKCGHKGNGKNGIPMELKHEAIKAPVLRGKSHQSSNWTAFSSINLNLFELHQPGISCQSRCKRTVSSHNPRWPFLLLCVQQRGREGIGRRAKLSGWAFKAGVCPCLTSKYYYLEVQAMDAG